MRPQTLVSTEVFISKTVEGEGFNSGKAHAIEPCPVRSRFYSDEL